MMEAMSGKRLFQDTPRDDGQHGLAALYRAGAADDAAQDGVAVGVGNMLTALRSAGPRAWHPRAAPIVAGYDSTPLRRSSNQVDGQNRGGPRRFIPRQHCFRKPPQRGAVYDVKYLTPNWDDEDRVIEFLQRTFFRHEPTMIATGLSGRVPESMLRMYRDNIREGMSIIAVNAQHPSEILGVAINGEVNKDTDSKELRSIRAECHQTRKIYDFWAFLLEKENGWPDDVTRVMELKAISTDPKASRSGLAISLTELSRRLAKTTLGYDAFRCECTSLYSSKMAAKVCLPRAFSFRYRDYLDKDGKPVFRIPSPHTEVAVYVENFKGFPIVDEDDEQHFKDKE